MTSAQISQQDIEHRLDLGLLNRWHPVAPSWMVEDKPVGLTRLGENVCLWRDKEGVIHMIEDRCPHRGARLSLGWNLGDRIACWYHGVETDKDGVVAAVPAVDACPLVGEKCVKSYPTFELKGGIFAWFGDELHEEPGEFEIPEELQSAEWDALLCTAHWRCNWRYAVDNVMDPMHGTYLHAVSHSMAEGDTEAHFKTEKTDHGFVFGKIDQRDVNFDWVEWADTGSPWMRVSPLPYRKSAGPGGHFGIIGFVTPIDEDNCRVFFWRTRQVQDWERDTWIFMYKHKLEGLHWDVLEQDRIILESLVPNARGQEFLYQHDTGLARVRRDLENEAKAQLTAVAEARASQAEAAE